MLDDLKTKFRNQIIRLREWRDLYLFNKYKRNALVAFDENWFKGKRVAIIGGADSAYKEKLGEYIESFDVVVRINNGVRVIDKYKDFIGERTDFLFHSLYTEKDEGESPIEIELWRRHNVRALIFSYNVDFQEYGSKYSFNFMKESRRSYPFSCVTMVQTMKNRELVYPTNPTTGIISINTILSCNPSLIYVTGITFFRTPHLKEYRHILLNTWNENIVSGKSAHNFEIEYSSFKKLYFSNKSTFLLDSTLQQIIDNDE